MDFELSDDQVALRQAAAALLAERSTPARLRALAGTPGADGSAAWPAAGVDVFDRDLWRAMAAQGWPAVALPEAVGGLGLGLVETAVLCEEIGRHLAPVPFTGTVLVAGALQRAVARGVVDPGTALGGTSVGEWVRRLGEGEAVGAVCWAHGTRPGGAVAAPVVFGPAADVVLVVAEGPALSAVALPEGDRPTAEPAMDPTRSLAWLDPGALPALPVGGADDAWHLVDRAATAVSAEMLGTAARVLDMTAAYAGDRVQFGRPIGQFQAVKHRCADMVVDVEGMRSSVYYAAWEVGAEGPDAAVAASAAKVWCSDAAARVMASGLQVHGGIGFTWEHDLHFHVKRSLLDQVAMGDARWHRDRLAGLLRRRVLAGEPVL